MRWISTTIKKKWMDKILSGEKKSELKGATKYWKKRIDKITSTYPSDQEETGINFLCGRKSYKYHIKIIIRFYFPKEIDGEIFNNWYEIVLGDRIK